MTDPTAAQPSISALPGTTTTRLVHRGTRGPSEWWRTAVVHLSAPPLLSAATTSADVQATVEELRFAARLGAHALRLGSPPLPTESSQTVRDGVEDLLGRAHRTGLRALLRIDAMDPRDEASAQYWLERGADGLDLGPVSTTDPVSHARYRELHALLAAHSHSDDPILTTRLTAAVQSRAGEMLHEDWLHHLVDAELVGLADPGRIVESVTQSYRVRDALGSPGAWLVPDVREAGSVQAARARALLVLALPGAAYLREGVAVGRPVATSPDPADRAANRAARAEQRGDASSSLELFRAALRLRADHRLGAAPLAWVEEMVPPAAPSTVAFLSGEVLVVANLGHEDVALAADREVLLSSAPLRRGRGGTPLLPPGETSWQWFAPAVPPPDPRARR